MTEPKKLLPESMTKPAAGYSYIFAIDVRRAVGKVRVVRLVTKCSRIL